MRWIQRKAHAISLQRTVAGSLPLARAAEVWSDNVAHDWLVSVEDFEAAQLIRADGGRGRKGQREARLRVIHPYVLRGLLYCGICGRRMQAQHNNQRTCCRCRYAKEYALASHLTHPVNVYIREEQLLPAVDGWLLKIFAPHRLGHTIRELATHHSAPAAPAAPDDSAAVIADCDARLARYQAALDAGGDPATIAGWTRTVTAQRAAALARAIARPASGTPLTEDAIQQIIQALGDIRDVIQKADPASKARIYTSSNCGSPTSPARTASMPKPT